MKKNIWIIVVIVLLLPYTIKAWAEYTIRLQGWDLVDSGKHLDWDGESAYLTQFKYGVKQWESHRAGVIREDTLTIIEDLKIQDKNEGNNGYAATTTGAGTMVFNTYYMSNYSTNKKRNIAIHELGHALGLDHRTGEGDTVMQESVTSIIVLCEGDKVNYDEAYKGY